MLDRHVIEGLHSHGLPDEDVVVIEPKRGSAIFEGTTYPDTWEGFVGQIDGKDMLQAAIEDAAARKTRLDHTAIFSGVQGVGKTTLAHLVAYMADVGFLATSGALSVDQFRALVMTMRDGDILFWDEFHMAVAGNKNRADWLLPFMLTGKLLGARGEETLPDITLIAATTEPGKLPATINDRFYNQVPIVGYTDEEASEIAIRLSLRMDIPIGDEELAEQIATAADHNPRVMERLLVQYRNLRRRGEVDMDKVYAWAGVTGDGLSSIALDVLLLLYQAPNQTLSIDSIRGKLHEPGPLGQHERMLDKRDLIEITGRGRTLTQRGQARVQAFRQSQAF